MGKGVFYSFFKVALSGFLVFCCAQKVALSGTQASLHPTDLVIPADLGHLTSVKPAPNAPASAKFLILLQDAHVNYEAQKNIAELIDQLASQYGIQLVLVEGGDGDVGLSYLRKRGSTADRKTLAEEQLQAGMISGEEYLDIVSDRPLILWGVDDRALYDRAVSTFMELEQTRGGLTQQLSQLRRLVERCRQRMPNEPLQRFEEQRAKFDAEQLAFSAYAAYLRGEAGRVGVATSGFQNLERAKAMAELEEGADPAQVEAEQRDVIRRLRQQAPAEDVAALKALAQGMNEKTATPAAFYGKLALLMDAAGIDRTTVPQLDRHIRYQRRKADLQLKALLEELSALQAQVKERLTQSPEEEELTSMADGLATFERLLGLDWSPEDYRAYQAHQDAWVVSRWLGVLRAHAQRLGVSWTWQAGDGASLDRQLAKAMQFYDAASARDTTLISRSLEKMEAEGAQAAVLIAGGFHSDHLAALLAERGVHAAIVTPWVGTEDDSQRYATILKAKYKDRRP